MLNLYEHIIMNNLLYSLGFAVQARATFSATASADNLLQLASSERKLADIFSELPGILRLVEFKPKQLNDHPAERARYVQLEAMIGKDEDMIALSKTLHWLVEIDPNTPSSIARIVPYLDAFPVVTKKYSLEQFVEVVAEDAAKGQLTYSPG